jgi:hypothetical protein
MNFQKIFWGIALLLLGLIMLLKHLGLIHIHIWYLIHFWPVILVIWGVFILPLKNNFKVIIAIAVLVITVALASYISVNKPGYFKNPHGIYFHDNNNGNDEWDNPYYDSDSNTTDI